MADSVTYEEFVKQENKRSGKHDISPTDTETTAIEDLQSTISEVQDNIKNLQEMMKEKLEGYQTVMNHQLNTLSLIHI